MGISAVRGVSYAHGMRGRHRAVGMRLEAYLLPLQGLLLLQKFLLLQGLLLFQKLLLLQGLLLLVSRCLLLGCPFLRRTALTPAPRAAGRH